MGDEWDELGQRGKWLWLSLKVGPVLSSPVVGPLSPPESPFLLRGSHSQSQAAGGWHPGLGAFCRHSSRRSANLIRNKLSASLGWRDDQGSQGRGWGSAMQLSGLESQFYRLLCDLYLSEPRLSHLHVLGQMSHATCLVHRGSQST